MLSKRNNAKIDTAQIVEAARQFGIPQKFAELLFLRGYDSKDKIEQIIYPDKAGFYDPYLLKGMKEAAKRIQEALKNKETVVVYGDYDADGVCSAAILSLFLSGFGLDVYTHIPSRDGDGYGLNIESLERIIEQTTPDLILTCDCGISCFNEAEYVMDLGVDIIITDHHEVPERIPSCVVVNPRQKDCEYPFKELCGAGIAFKLVQALSSTKTAAEYLDLAAIATVADLVPLIDENRLIVRRGLEKINSRANVGIDRILKALNLTNVASVDIAFKIAPRLNAAGRMGDASRAFDLLISDDESKADAIIKDLEKDNENRKQACERLYSDAIAMLKTEQLYRYKSIILYNPVWEKGITGIAAARLAGEFRRPVVIMARSGGCYKGTARSVEGINVHDALVSVKDLLTEFGGHSQAAGFSVDERNVDELKDRLLNYFDGFDDQYFLPRCYYDTEIEEHEISGELIKSLDLLEPYGHNNPRPLFRLSGDKFRYESTKSTSAHTLITSESGFNTIAFNFSASNNLLRGEGKKDLIIELRADTYNQGAPGGILRSCHNDELFIDDAEAQANYLKTLNFKLTNESVETYCYKPEELSKIIGHGIYGALIIAGQKKSYEKSIAFCTESVIIKECLKSGTKNNYNRLIVAPDFDENLMPEFYDKIIFLDTPPHKNLLSYISRRTSAKIYIPEENNFAEFLSDLDLSRAAFGECYKAICACPDSAANLRAYYDTFRLKQNISLKQFVVCLTVFVEIGLITVNAKQGFSVNIIKGAKAELGTSAIYNYLSNYGTT